MSGYNTILKIRQLEQRLDQLGMMMCQASQYYRDFGDMVAVQPRDSDSLPIYSRDAELFVGTLEALEYWIQGIEWARKYDTMLFGRRHSSNRERREQQHRNEQLVSTLSQPTEKLNEAQ
jgi:hypothetical protein